MNKDSVELKTGTTIVCIKSKTQLILASDKQISTSFRKAGSTSKIYILENFLFAGSGAVSHIQMFFSILELAFYYLKQEEIDTQETDTFEMSVLTFLKNELIQMGGAYASFFICWKKKDILRAFHLDGDGSLLEVDLFDSIGSGSIYSLGFFSSYSKEKILNLKDKGLIAFAKQGLSSAHSLDLYTGVEKEYVLLDKEGFSKIQLEAF